MTEHTNTDANSRRQTQPGPARPVEPGRRHGDPLLKAISAYSVGLNRFHEYAKTDVTDVTDAQRDEYAERSYIPPMEALSIWDGGPARSLDGARAAVRVALEEEKDFASSSRVPRMLDAALNYLDKPATEGRFGDIAAFTMSELRHAAQCLAALHSTPLLYAVSPWVEGNGPSSNPWRAWAWELDVHLNAEAEAIVAEINRRPIVDEEDHEDERMHALISAYPSLNEPGFRRTIVVDAA